MAHKRRTNALIKQFSGYAPIPGTYLAADQMIGEIVGDLAGTSIAYRAYELYLADQGVRSPPILDGFTGPQRFFLAAAQQARTVARKAALRDIALHETHPPAEYRINGIFRNVDAWYRAFGVDDQASLYLPPKARVVMW